MHIANCTLLIELNMQTKRIIPCLDIKEGRTVKGVNFVDLRDAGDAVELAKRYEDEGADELVFLDITATVENRGTLTDLVKRVSQVIHIPLTVGGGIRSVSDAETIIQAGADKVSISSAAVDRPMLISELADRLGSHRVVVAIDTKHTGDDWIVHVHGGRTATTRRTIEWAREVEQLGAGEILLTSMNHDGTKKGFAIDITREVCETVNIPSSRRAVRVPCPLPGAVPTDQGECRAGRIGVPLRGDIHPCAQRVSKPS